MNSPDIGSLENNYMLKVGLISCFYRRYSCVQRIIRMYLLQTYEGPSILLLYNNSPEIYELENIVLPENKQIILINNYKDLETGEEYRNVGDIFRDALSFMPEVDIINHMDVDDIYSPNHISEGVRGYKEALNQNKLAYKSYFSYHKYMDKVSKEHNTMEPSIYVDANYLREIGYDSLPSSYHQKWELPLRTKDLIHNPNSEITFLYYWPGDDNCYKISGKGDGQENFDACRQSEKDIGNNILGPCSEEEIQKYYNIVNWKI